MVQAWNGALTKAQLDTILKYSAHMVLPRHLTFSEHMDTNCVGSLQPRILAEGALPADEVGRDVEFCMARCLSHPDCGGFLLADTAGGTCSFLGGGMSIGKKGAEKGTNCWVLENSVGKTSATT